MAKLLLIEDDASVRTALQAVLQHAGHDVTLAEHGRDALLKTAEGTFDLVITDVLMPEMDGIETILALKRAMPDMKIIAISGAGACGKVDFLGMAKRLGASETLRKPVDSSELQDVVVRALARSKAPSELVKASDLPAAGRTWCLTVGRPADVREPGARDQGSDARAQREDEGSRPDRRACRRAAATAATSDRHEPGQACCGARSYLSANPEVRERL